MRHSQVVTCPWGGLTGQVRLKGECCWSCCCSMSATAAAVTSEQDTTCGDIIHAKVDSKCTEQQLAVHAHRSQSICVQKCRILAVLDA